MRGVLVHQVAVPRWGGRRTAHRCRPEVTEGAGHRGSGHRMDRSHRPRSRRGQVTTGARSQRGQVTGGQVTEGACHRRDRSHRPRSRRGRSRPGSGHRGHSRVRSHHNKSGQLVTTGRQGQSRSPRVMPSHTRLIGMSRESRPAKVPGGCAGRLVTVDQWTYYGYGYDGRVM